jgi:tRNA-specific 2-thiouridylase
MPNLKSKTVFVAMSGGVDSSVAAALLKERGFDVRGVHIKMWSDPDIPCAFKEDRYDAMKVAAKLNIPFETWDFTREYREAVVEYMIREYAQGRTPNPDVMCNRHIKFGVFLKRALESGADYVAMGHYVRLGRNFEFRNSNFEIDSKFKIQNLKLFQAKDQNKDQSYFLWTLTQEQLKHCLFPIGDYTKPEVRELARRFGLPTAEKKDSQGICFIGELDIRDFLKKYIPVSRGPVLTTSGKIIGEHEGLSFYTIGQREGLGIGGGTPYYVAAKDYRNNILTVAEGPYDARLFSKTLEVTDINWISGQNPKLSIRCEARIRYRQPLQSCVVKCQASSVRYSVSFKEPQRAVTPGQSIVFYKNGEMLGGGIIV